MAAMSNVARGVESTPHCTAMGRGTPCPRFLPRLFCSLLLLAPSALGIGLRGGDSEDPPALDAASAVENEAGLAVDATGKAVEQTKDAARLAASERKKMGAHLHSKAVSLLPAAMTDADDGTNYLVASFPELRCVMYVRLPDLVWRPLIVADIMSPKSLAIDQDRGRLYLADTALAKIVWYQLITLPDKTLISDGRQHIAVQAMAVRNLALDLSGNLWFSGKSCPTPPIPSTDAIWKQSLMTIDQSALSGTPIDAIPQWTNAATKSSVSPLVLDAFNIFYGNDVEGKSKGSVVKASQSVPASDPASGLSAYRKKLEVELAELVERTSVQPAPPSSFRSVPPLTPRGHTD